MFPRFPTRFRASAIVLVAVAAAAVMMLFVGEVNLQEFFAASQAVDRKPAGHAQLVSYEPLPALDGEMCQWVPASASTTLAASLQQDVAADRGSARESVDLDRAPVRVL